MANDLVANWFVVVCPFVVVAEAISENLLDRVYQLLRITAKKCGKFLTFFIRKKLNKIYFF